MVSPEFHGILAGLSGSAIMMQDFRSWLEIAEEPPPGCREFPGGADLSTPWLAEENIPMYIVSGSTLLLRRGGARSKNETILTDVATFLGKTTKSLVLRSTICIKVTKGKDLSGEGDRIMQLTELALR